MKTKLVLLVVLIVLRAQFSTAQKSFSVSVKGKGEPILLFPRFGCTGELWNETVEELSKTNECHIFTFAGFGTVPPIETPWFTTIKNELISYVKDKKLYKPTLLGHSLGGTLSLWLASTETTLFKKAILVDSLPASAALMIPNYNGEIIEYDNPQSKMMLEMDKNSFEAMNSQSIPFMCLNKEKHKIITSWMNMADRKTYVHGYIDMLNLDLRKEISKIKITVVILAATSLGLDIVKSTYTSQYQNLPSVQIRHAENAGHFVMYDQPDWFIKNVKLALK